MTKYYFTFGSGHHDTHGRSLAKNYVVIEAADPLKARMEMFRHFGPKWASQYTWENFEYQISQYGLEEFWIEGVELCCGVEQVEYLRLKTLNVLDPFDYVEPCEPECSAERHARHQGQWDMALKINEALGLEAPNEA